jgi:putative tryptophan/tyrosine transport system substrate-binding protein
MPFDQLHRREFITLLGGAAVAWPFAAGAQQPAMLVIGFLNSQSPEMSIFAGPLRGFHQGLRDTGYTEGSNVAIDYRWANNQLDQLSALADDLVRKQVAVIVATGGATSGLAAKAATSTIPIVFATGDDPVRLGLVASLSRPSGNLTGVSIFVVELAAKRLELVRELVPGAGRIAVLVNPANATDTEVTVRDTEAAARAMGLQIQVLKASSTAEIDAAFAALGHDRPDALLVAPGPPFTTRHVQLIQLAAYHRIPAIYTFRQSAEIGGLISYGTSLTDAYRQVGVYTGRILKGASPADLPVVRSSKFELVINAQTARMFGLEIPPTLLARADEVIE